MIFHCKCGQEFSDRSERCCPRCGSIEGLETIRWVRLYCACGHTALRRAELTPSAFCPVCKGQLAPKEGEPLVEEPPVPLPSEEMVLLDDERIPLRNWEAEVLLRAVGRSDTVRGVALVAVLPLLLLRDRVRKDDLSAASVGALFGFVLFFEGRNLFLRSVTSWKVLIVTHALLLTCLGCAVGNSRNVQVVDPDVGGALLLMILFLPDLLCLYVLVGPGRPPLFLVWRDEPLAPLSSIRAIGPTVRSAAAWCILVIAILQASAPLVMAAAPWIERLLAGF